MFYLRRLRCSLSQPQPGLRKLLVVAMLGAYLAATIGYPEYHAAASKDGSEPFPCQHRACGCRTAEQCRKNCCCHTKEAKIAWAWERGIDPNRVAILTPEESAACARRTPGTLCRTVTKKACCQPSANNQSNKMSCCSKGSAPAGLNFVVGVHAQKCRGNGVDWIQAGFVALPPKPVTLVIVRPTVPHSITRIPSYLSPVPGRLDRPG